MGKTKQEACAFGLDTDGGGWLLYSCGDRIARYLGM